jgi:dimeric dUTPase (all-alpha-NTP-PPase superfamily)
MNLNPLYEVQKNVDMVIANNLRIEIHKEENVMKRIIAFKVEVGEFGNEIGFFKYWKQSHVMDRVKTIEELADCMAFLLSIGISRGYQVDEIDPYQWEKVPMEHLFNYLFRNKIQNRNEWQTAFENLMCIGLRLGFAIAEMEFAYYTKSGVNIERQKNCY